MRVSCLHMQTALDLKCVDTGFCLNIITSVEQSFAPELAACASVYLLKGGKTKFS
jgi:hypothetical protein